jgi:endo-alpha-1,4-polygalactosaminidase (GH114 family)
MQNALPRRYLSVVLGLCLLTRCSDGAGGNGGQNPPEDDRQIFHPAPGTTWQWQLSGLPIDTSFDVAVYDVDLFTTTEAEMKALRAAGRVVICYFSAGSYEDFRPDKGEFPAGVKGKPLEPPFQDELWLDIRAAKARAIMKARLDRAVKKGCDGVEPDNVDGFANDNGLGLTAQDQLEYNRFIAAEAHARRLSVGLKNDMDQLQQLEPDFDWALNEECVAHDECAPYANTFIAAGKAVFHAEYADEGQLDALCAATRSIGLSTLVKHVELDAWQLPCAPAK